MHRHTRANMQTHAGRRARKNARTHARAQSGMHGNTHVPNTDLYTFTLTHVRVHICTDTYTSAHTHEHTHWSIHIDTNNRTRRHTHKCTRAHARPLSRAHTGGNCYLDFTNKSIITGWQGRVCLYIQAFTLRFLLYQA